MPPKKNPHNQPSPIVPIDQRTVPEDVLQETVRYLHVLNKEHYPEYPLLPPEEMIKAMRNPPEETMEYATWAIFDGKRLIARATGWVNLTEPGIPTFMASLTVLPEYRRKGLATRLLEPLRDYAHRHGKSTLIFEASDRLPSGIQFLTHLGAEPGLEGHSNRLYLPDLDRQLMQGWVHKADERNPGFNLKFFEGVPPDNLMDSYCTMVSTFMQTQPSGSVQFPFKDITPEWVREMFNLDIRAGRRFWTLLAIEASTGCISGYTDMLFHPRLPQLIYQGGTCVLPEFRNRGIGRWVKAGMVLKLVEEVPEARWFITANADVNASMLKINNEMGYKPFEVSNFWQYHLS